MSDSFEHNARVIGERWPALLARVQAEDAAVLQADLVEGLGSTLSIGGVQLTSRHCLLYTSPSPRDRQKSRMPSSA